MTAANRQGRARTRAPRITSPLLQIATTLFVALPAPAWAQTLHDTGRWTPPHNVGRTAIHMALLRGQSPYHSEVIWWYGLNDEQGPFAGGMVGWKSVEYDCGSWSGTSFTPDTLPTPAVNVFCGSNSVMADGKLFVAGGTQSGTEFGLKRANIFDWASRQWTEVDSMALHRWYATSTSLATGGQLVSSGSHDHVLHFFSGIVNADTFPLDSALFRYGDGAGGQAYDALRLASPDTTWPSPREGHTAVKIGTDFKVHMFGGKNRLGAFLNDYWQATPGGAFEPDVRWTWINLNPLGDPPAKRWDHTAVATQQNPRSWMIVFGGIRKNAIEQEVVTNDVWRLWFDSTPLHGLTWTQVTTHASPSGDSPGARCGHVALWRKATSSDSTAGIYVGRMLVFGGRDSPGGNPSEASLWSLNFTDTLMTEATWEKLSATGPNARFHHALGYDATAVGYYDTAYVFGGEAANGEKLNDLWRLNVSTLTWSPVDYLQGQDSAPTERARATATLEGRLLFVFGGRSDDSTMHVAQLGGLTAGQAQTWTNYRVHNPALTGHVAFIEGVHYARTPEIFSSGGTWSLLNKPHLQAWYPQAFVWKADTVFFSGPEDSTYKFSMNGPTWKKFPSSPSGFLGGTAVMYRPGKVMKCGSTDWQAVAVGTTKSIDLSAPDTAQWRHSANLMQPRENHNLVLLPNGKVMVVGGSGKHGGAEPKYGPEVWDPDFNNGQGQWSGYGTLAAEHRIRDYHSTALLLPDGRILSGGGNAELFGKDSLEVFCPPYLFKTDGMPATRPAIGSAVERVRYGAQFSACLSSSDSISSVCLIRAGAVTHGFDQNQRYVPLTFTPVNSTATSLTVTAPADSFVAPPGDYLFFLVNKQGVPSIARWTRVGSVWDSGDVTPPDSVADLDADVVTQNKIYWTWTVPGDDAASGEPWQRKLVTSIAPITPAYFYASSPAGNAVPGCVGSAATHIQTGLSSCTEYYASIQFVDESNHYSPIGYSPAVSTLCLGGGGGLSAHAAREEGGSGNGLGGGTTRSRPLRIGPSAASLPEGGANGVLVADYCRNGRSSRSIRPPRPPAWPWPPETRCASSSPRRPPAASGAMTASSSPAGRSRRAN